MAEIIRLTAKDTELVERAADAFCLATYGWPFSKHYEPMRSYVLAGIAAALRVAGVKLVEMPDGRDDWLSNAIIEAQNIEASKGPVR